MAKISIEKRPCRREGCGFTQDSKTVLRERADVETRFGLLASVESAAPTTFLNTGRLHGTYPRSSVDSAVLPDGRRPAAIAQIRITGDIHTNE